jgi:hypothetical protein
VSKTRRRIAAPGDRGHAVVAVRLATIMGQDGHSAGMIGLDADEDASPGTSTIGVVWLLLPRKPRICRKLSIPA